MPDRTSIDMRMDKVINQLAKDRGQTVEEVLERLEGLVQLKPVNNVTDLKEGRKSFVSFLFL